MISIPLNTKATLQSALRLILKDGIVHVHTSLDQRSFTACGTEIVGVDKGYTEALADSNGDFHGKGFGKLMTEGTEKRHLRGIARNKLYQIAKKTKNKRKAKRICKFNLGRKKPDHYNHCQYEQLRTKAFEAAHRIVDIAKEVRAEDLSKPFASSEKWKSYNRRMSSWSRSLLSEALHSVTEARGSRLRLVNAAYTSQMDSKTRRLEGRRVGDRFYHVNGDVSHADTNAAVNIKHRAEDTEISLYTPYKEVKVILLSRLTDNGGVSSHMNDRPSRTPVTRRKRTLTESESTRHLITQSCQSFL
jgi:transposase